MRNITTTFKPSAALMLVLSMIGCEEFLETKPYGSATLQTLTADESGAEALLISAYSCLDGVCTPYGQTWSSAASNWIYGSVLGGDAYKGSVMNDQPNITWIETHTNLQADNVNIDSKWTNYYNGIARANEAINAFQIVNMADKSHRNKRIAEALFLRGFYHFELRKIFGNVPYIDETIKDVRIGNTEPGNMKKVLLKIQSDFLDASRSLPLEQSDAGRITKGAAIAFLGITKMWLHDYDSAKTCFEAVILSNKYQLNARFDENFNADFRNNKESILAVQQSVNEGTPGLNGNPGDVLNYPPVFGHCCGFHQPSQNLVNAFKTDASGLPLLDSYNFDDVTSDEGVPSSSPFIPYTGTLDPRLDWTVGRREIPYLDWGKHAGQSWISSQADGGPYSPKKYVLYQKQEADYLNSSSWTDIGITPAYTANNLKLLRYADLLLYAAEAEVELGRLDLALGHVNMVRTRAGNSAGFVKNADGSDAAKYKIATYPPFPDQAFARKAVRFERRLELAMEGHRFFDLVRWGVAAEEKNEYFKEEQKKRSHLKHAAFEKGKHEYMPIPAKALELSYKDGKATLQQNPGY